MVVSGGNSFCIDNTHVVKIEVIAASHIQKSGDKEALPSESGVLPIVRLRELLGQTVDESVSTDLVHIITCEFPGKGPDDIHEKKALASSLTRWWEVRKFWHAIWVVTHHVGQGLPELPSCATARLLWFLIFPDLFRAWRRICVEG
jgi:hypothetical protein